jgi:hypothetical protein
MLLGPRIRDIFEDLGATRRQYEALPLTNSQRTNSDGSLHWDRGARLLCTLEGRHFTTRPRAEAAESGRGPHASGPIKATNAHLAVVMVSLAYGVVCVRP